MTFEVNRTRIVKTWLFRIFFGLVLLLVLLHYLFSPPPCVAPPEEHYSKAKIPGFSDEIRYWGDVTVESFYKYMERMRPYVESKGRFDILAISGGGDKGAYGAGFLKGWTDQGGRPEFTLVTGISTGAILAPFAFLGPEYDSTLKKIFTESSTKSIFSYRPLNLVLGGAEISDTSPLREILEDLIDDDFVSKLAAEGKKGRMLLIGTTNLHAQRPVVWNITNIAQSGHKDARELILDAIMASAAIPGLFPPVLIDVEVDGKIYQELHVEGGVTRRIFIYPSDMDINKLGREIKVVPEKNIWLILNSKLDLDYSSVEFSVTDIVEHSLSTMVKYYGRGDIHNVLALAKRDGFTLKATHVPASFDVPDKELIDPDFMSELYKVGFEEGGSISGWHDHLLYLE